MRIGRLHLRNFRCFDALDLDFGQTTVLVGANNTGKSVVLEALRWLFGAGGASCDWQGATRRSADGRRHQHFDLPITEDAAEALILAELNDLNAAEAEEWRAVAPDGVIRVAKSAKPVQL